MSDAPYKFNKSYQEFFLDHTHLNKTEDYLISYLVCLVLCLLTSLACIISGNVFSTAVHPFSLYVFIPSFLLNLPDSSVETLSYNIRVIFSMSQSRQLRYHGRGKYAGRKFLLEFKFAIWPVAISLNLKSAYNYFFEISQ